MPFLTAARINKSYQVGTQHLHVLRDLDMAIERGERVAVVGASGVGKSTLLHLLGGLDRADSGSIVLDASDIGAMPDDALTAFRNKRVGFVFQFHHLLPEFTALENAEMPLRISRMSPADSRRRAEAVLQRLGLGDRLTHRPSMLSGGEQQRVAVARALVTEPSVLLADEPTGDLDEQTAEALHALLREMHRERNLSSVIATHNMHLAASCDRVFRLEGGRLVEQTHPFEAGTRAND